jgi:hypothetical protein
MSAADDHESNTGACYSRALEKISALQEELARVQAENDRLKEQTPAGTSGTIVPDELLDGFRSLKQVYDGALVTGFPEPVARALLLQTYRQASGN